MNSTPPLPYLKSERHYRLYAGYIEKIISDYPEPVIFTPQAPVASVETLSSRIRICVGALYNSFRFKLNWNTPITLAQLAPVMGDLVISTAILPGKVVCGPREKLQLIQLSVKNSKLPPTSNSNVELERDEQASVPKIKLDNPPKDLLEAVIILHHYRVFGEPSVIELLDDDLVETLTFLSGKYDIAVEKDGNTYTIL